MTNIYEKQNCFKCPVNEKPKIDNINVCKIRISNIINSATKHNYKSNFCKNTKKVTQKKCSKSNVPTNY